MTSPDDAPLLVALHANFDHVAHAVPSIRAAVPLYQGLLGGRPFEGGINPWGQHLAIQFKYPGGGIIELLEPVHPESPSVGRFLQKNPRGGLHHITFKVPDLAESVRIAEEWGYAPFGTMLDNPSWRETYLHPRQTGGVLIQLAEPGPDFSARLERPLEDLLDETEARMRAASAESAVAE
jgi:methylmalonyl-CoA/ethylmalonyl-CoA epimerase